MRCEFYPRKVVFSFLEVVEKGVVGRSEVFAVCLVNPFAVAAGVSVFVIEGFELSCECDAQFQVIGTYMVLRFLGFEILGRQKPRMYEEGGSDYGSVRFGSARSEPPTDAVVVLVLLCSCS